MTGRVGGVVRSERRGEGETRSPGTQGEKLKQLRKRVRPTGGTGKGDEGDATSHKGDHNMQCRCINGPRWGERDSNVCDTKGKKNTLINTMKTPRRTSAHS